MVYEDDLDFPPVIGVDRPRRIENRDAVLHGKSRARADLTFRICRQRHANSGRDQRSPAGRNRQRGIGRDCGQEVEPGGALALIGRQRQVGSMWKPHQLDVDFLHTNLRNFQ
jgi:hypothetical protein